MNIEVPHEAAEILVQALLYRVENLEAGHEFDMSRFALVLGFLGEEHPDKLLAWVKYVYATDSEIAKRVLTPFHELGYIDLSSVDCSRKDFS